MQEVFKKIIERFKSEVNYNDGAEIGLKQAIEIVNQEAEQYNNGWIPCSERLPEKLCHNVLVTYEDRYIGGIYDVCEGQYVHGLNEWHISDYDIVDDFNVIAWCEKPIPYQPKGE